MCKEKLFILLLFVVSLQFVANAQISTDSNIAFFIRKILY
jgi:hypothetical protein